MQGITRPMLSLLLSLLFSGIVLAQTQQPTNRPSPPVVTATASNSQVRYISIGEVRQTRLQVFSQDGAEVFDSDFRLGNLIDWQLTDQQGSHLTDGSYLFLVTVKDFADRLTQKYGTAVLDHEQVYLEQTMRDGLPQAQASALDAGRQSEILLPVDRIGAASINRLATLASTDNNSPTVAPSPSSIESSKPAPAGTIIKSSSLVTGGTNISGSGTTNKLAKWNDNSGTLVDSALTEIGGNLGIGATSPNYKLVVGPALQSGFVAAAMTVSRGANLSSSILVGTGTNAMEFGWDNSNLRAFLNAPGTTPIAFTQNGSTVRMYINNLGNIGIGTVTPQSKLDVAGDISVAGNATVTGNIAAKYQDVAEWVQSRQQMKGGTVVILDTTRANAVTPSHRAYDTHIAGVVSERPGVILGESGAGKVMVATTGRVKVKVDATRYPIRIGDLLVTSGRPGVAMRSRPVRAGRALIHRPGTILGKALEPLAGGQGEIMVLLSLQ